jgi:methyl-galactoside transport system ATP-binding protein/inositol transport system ATP-binding protein
MDVKMNKIFRISDDITTDRAEILDVNKLSQLMVGREVTEMFPKARQTTNTP